MRPQAPFRSALVEAISEVITRTREELGLPAPRSGRAKPIQYVMDPNECHNCISHCLNHGYPVIHMGTWRGYLVRALYIARYGEIPARLVCRHTCDNSLCINPAHIVLGTRGDNARDRRRLLERDRIRHGIQGVDVWTLGAMPALSQGEQNTERVIFSGVALKVFTVSAK